MNGIKTSRKRANMGREAIPGHLASDIEKALETNTVRVRGTVPQNGDDTDLKDRRCAWPCQSCMSALFHWRRWTSWGTPCIIFAHGLEANVDHVEHGWHGRDVGGWRRSEQRRWWLAGEEPVQSQVIQRVRRCSSRSSTTQEPIRVLVDRLCLDNVEVVESCGYDSSKPIQSCWYEPAYSAGSPTWQQGLALIRPVWPPRHRHGSILVSRPCSFESICLIRTQLKSAAWAPFANWFDAALDSRSWGDMHPSPG